MNIKKIFILITMAISQIISAKPSLEQDTNLIVEKLDNGLTIAVYKNAEPPNRVSMRLLVKRGSIHEFDNEQGIAHYTEHMAFNGTKNFPSGDMVEYFQRLGMAFGADTNAHTGFAETVYKLEMPEVSDKLINDGIMLLRDYADSMLFDVEAIDKERGVIIAEKDSRDDQDYRKAVKEIAHVLKGTIYEDRMPIGKTENIESFKQEDFKKFYQANYRPENSVVIIVGDIDPVKIMEITKKYFQDWQGSTQQPNRIAQYGALETSDIKFDFNLEKIDFDVVCDYTANVTKSYASVTVAKANDGIETIDSLVESVRYRAIANALTMRISRLKSLPESKISEGYANVFNIEPLSDIFSLSVFAPVGYCFEALEEAFSQILSIENLQDSELEVAKQKIIQSTISAVKSASTRKNKELSNGIVSAFSDGETFTSPEKDLEIVEYALADFDSKKAVEMLKDFYSNIRFKIFLSDSQDSLSESQLNDRVAAAYKNAYKNRYPAELFSTEELKFSKFDSKGKILNKTYIEDLDITQIEFENGVRLNLKKTDFSKDSILMKVSFGNGLLDIPEDKPQYYFATNALIFGGTKFQTMSEISAAKYAMKMNISSSIDGNSFTIFSSSNVKDFSNALNFVATVINDAGFRDDGLSSMTKEAQRFFLGLKTEPSSIFRFLTQKISSDSITNLPGTFEDFKKIKMSDIKAWLEPILKESYMEISVVGDIDIDDTIDMFESTFAAMPKRQSQKPDAFASVNMRSTDEPLNFTYETADEPRSLTLKLWKTAGRSDSKNMRTDNVLSAILDDVIRKNIREEEGNVYSPFATNSSNIWIKDFGITIAGSFVTPEFNGKVADKIQECASQVIESISEDAFERAKIPLLKGLEANKRNNAYWLDSVLDLSQCKPLNIELARTLESGYNAVELNDVKRRAKEIYTQKPYSITVLPTSETSK